MYQRQVNSQAYHQHTLLSLALGSFFPGCLVVRLFGGLGFGGLVFGCLVVCLFGCLVVCLVGWLVVKSSMAANVEPLLQ